MPKTTALGAAFLAALLLMPVPLASAGKMGKDEPVTIAVPPLRVGDRLLYETQDPFVHGDGEPFSSTVMLVEPPARVADGFGVVRDADVFRIERRYEESGARLSVTCHRLQGGREAVFVRPEGGYGAAGFSYGGSTLTGSTHSTRNVSLAGWFSGACSPATLLGGRTLREGDRLRFEEVGSSSSRDLDDDSLSEPAIATTAHGRAALCFTFVPKGALREGDGLRSVEVVVADGLPAILSVTAQTQEEGVPSGFRTELRGIERGEGVELTPYRGLRLPLENPAATFHAPGPLGLDDRAFGFAFPYADALEALRNDPDFILWLRDHPRAFLLGASYTRRSGQSADATDSPDVSSPGSWSLRFRDGDHGFAAFVSRADGVRTSAGAVPAPFPLDVSLQNGGSENSGDEHEAAPPARVADSTAMVRVFESVGIGPGDVESFEYVANFEGVTPRASFTVSNIPDDDGWSGQGLEARADVVTGRLWTLQATQVETTRTPGLLAPGGGSLAAERPSGVETLSAIAGPNVGSGLVVGGATATGLALLLVLLKFLAIPLFTRLRRDRLLDHPVRARIHERVRAEPGIHLAELEELTGIGRGATRHHVDQLVKSRFLVEVRDDGFTRYFAAGEVPPDVARRAAVLRAGSTREVYDLLQREPNLSLREAAKRLALSAPSVHRAKKRLEEAGLLPAAREARIDLA